MGLAEHGASRDGDASPSVVHIVNYVVTCVFLETISFVGVVS